ncbi:MAG: CDP-glucose 4,6-dehydratase [Acidobacteriota bacterium]
MNADFWKSKRVLVTGHTGFKGSWLCLWLSRLGADVTGFALEAPTSPSLFHLAHAEDAVRSLHGDVRDGEAFLRAVREARPEIIIHMAAQTVVRTGYDAPFETYETNVMGTVNLFEAVRRTDSVRAVVNVTTDKCYENREWEWAYRETDALGGYDPYSNSKACSELVTSAYRQSFFSTRAGGIGIATARAGNVLGGGDWTTHQLVPDIMRGFMERRAVVIRNPHAVRPWQFVLEPLRGYLTLAERLYHEPARFSQAWNFGPADDDARPVSWIADTLTRFWGDDASWRLEAAEAQRVHEAGMLRLDSSKARTHLDWKPRMRLAQTLEFVVEWYKAYYHKHDVRDLTELHITRYELLEHP